MEKESLFNLAYRLNNSSVYSIVDEPDKPIINKRGVTIIDWKLSDSNAVHRYLNRLIIKNLKKYFKKREEDKNLENEKRETKKRKLNESIQLNELNKEPLVTIFDNFCTFNELQLINFRNKKIKSSAGEYKVLDQIERLNESNNLNFYITIRNYFGNLIDLIKDRLLVIIFLNDIYFEKFLNHLSKREFNFHLVIITHNNLPMILQKNMNNFKSLDYLKINDSPNDASKIEIIKYDKKKYKSELYEIEDV